MIKNFHGDDVLPSPPEDALFHIIPVPLEQSVSYGEGTALGSVAILDASAQLETLTLGVVPADKGIYTAPPVLCDGDITEVVHRIESEVENAVSNNALPVILGGEHTVSLGSLAPLKRAYGEFGVVQFDAHADLRDEYDGSRFSHAAVMRRFHEQGIPLCQLGTRSYCLEEDEYRKQNRESICWFDGEELVDGGIKEILLPQDFPENIYLTFDIDGLDASIMPATGTPVPGGLGWYQTQALLQSILQQRRCIGFDLVEFAPIDGQHAWAFTAAQLTYNIMALCVKSRG